MDFSLTKEQQDIKMAAREFAEKEFSQVAQECDENEKMDMALLKKARELGFVGTHLPEEYGGFGMSYFEKALITEEFWRVDPGVAHSILSITFGSEIIVEHGTEEQKKKFLPNLIQGDGIIAGAITEPNKGGRSCRVCITL